MKEIKSKIKNDDQSNVKLNNDFKYQNDKEEISEDEIIVIDGNEQKLIKEILNEVFIPFVTYENIRNKNPQTLKQQEENYSPLVQQYFTLDAILNCIYNNIKEITVKDLTDKINKGINWMISGIMKTNTYMTNYFNFTYQIDDDNEEKSEEFINEGLTDEKIDNELFISLLREYMRRSLFDYYEYYLETYGDFEEN